MTIWEISEQQRMALFVRDAALLARIAALWTSLQLDVRAELARMLREAELARSRGGEISPGWLRRQKQLKLWLQQIEARINVFSVDAAYVTAAEQQSLALIAGRNVAQISASFGNIQTSAAEHLIGFAGDGSPLVKIFKAIAPDTVEKVTQTMFNGIAKGQNPMVTARELERNTNAGKVRAQTIARTETLRVYRESSHENAKANSDVVMGWYWQASKSDRTCAMCLAMDGTFHTLSKRLVSHPACRCTQIWATETPGRVPQRGSAWFHEQPAVTQDFILGPTAGAMYRQGEVKLEDFVGQKRDKDWGQYYYRRSLQAALGRKSIHPGYKRSAA